MQRQPVIVAVMQPNWFKVANAIKFRSALQLYSDVEQWRQVMLRSEQGKKYQRYMKDLFDITIWRCANPDRPVSNAPGKDYNVNHVAETLKMYSPDIVIAFGPSAQNAILDLYKKKKPDHVVFSDDINPKPVVDFGIVNMCADVRKLIEKL